MQKAWDWSRDGGMEKIWKLLGSYGGEFLKGLGGTLYLAAATVALGTALGILVALLQMSRFRPAHALAQTYTEILRGTPILLQLYFFWIGLPKLFPVALSDFACILIALVVNSSSYIAEIIRAGVGAVDAGQWEAARSVGLSEAHVLARVILPQAVRNILPALGNQFIQMVKETSLASVFFVGELMTSYKTVQAATFLALQPLAIVGAIYFLMNVVLSRLEKRVERRLMVYG